MTKQMARALEFGSFRMDLTNAQLWCGKKRIKMRPKTWAVLNYLAQHPGRLILKNELIDSVWTRGHVTTTALRVCIREIRIALGESVEQPQYIETHGQIGYRFVAKLKNEVNHALSHEAAEFMVGRDTEFERLENLFGRAMQGYRQCVFLTGEAGVGKTTLLQTFLRHSPLNSNEAIAEVANYEAWVGLGQCVEQFSAGEAYRPILEALGRICRGQFGAQLIEQLNQYAPSWLVQMPTLLEDRQLNALKSRVNEGNQERMQREMTEALDVVTKIRPMILVFEDLHWCDTSTVELLSSLARRQEHARLIIIGTLRSFETRTYSHPLYSAMQELQLHNHCVEIALPALPTAAVQEYLTRRFPNADSLSTLAELVYRKSSGNPLFMVNTINALITEGLVVESQDGYRVEHDQQRLAQFERNVPGNLQRMIEQQLTLLQPNEQALLRVASVAGHDFSAAIVAAGMAEHYGSAVESLEQKLEELALHCPFIVSSGVAEWPDGTISSKYRFSHALYQNVAYSQLATARRIKLHRIVGMRLEKGFAPDTTEHAAELALHFIEGRDKQKAVHYLHLAAINSHKRNAAREAISYLAQAFETLKEIDKTHQRDTLELALIFTYGPLLMATKGSSAPAVKEIYEKARRLCKRQKKTPEIFKAIKGLWQYYLTFGDLNIAHDMGLQLLDIAQATNDSSLLLGAHEVMASTLHPMGKTREALEHAQQGIAVYKSDEHQSLAMVYAEDPGVACRCIEVVSLSVLGYPDKATKKFHTLFEIANNLDHAISTINALSYTSVCHHFNRNYTELRAQAKQMIELSEKHSFSFWSASGYLLHGLAITQQGEIKLGMKQIRRGLADAQATDAGIYRSYCLGIYAEACLFANDIADGLMAVELGLEHVAATGERSYESELYRLKGELLTRNNKADSAPHKKHMIAIENCFQKAKDLASKQHLMLFNLRATVCLAGLWQQQAKEVEALQILKEACDWFSEGVDHPDIRGAKQLIRDLTS